MFEDFNQALEEQAAKNLAAQQEYDDSLSVDDPPIDLGRSDNFRYDPSLSGGSQVGVRIGDIPEPDDMGIRESPVSQLSREDIGRMDVDAAQRSGEILQTKEKGVPTSQSYLGWLLRKKLENASPEEQERILKEMSQSSGKGTPSESRVEPAAVPEVPVTPPVDPTVPEPPTSRGAIGARGDLPGGGYSGIPPVPGPSAGPQQAIKTAAAQPPAQSIKEYIKMMREQGKTPSFTNIAQSSGQAQVPGQAGDSYYMPEKGRVITSGPSGYDVQRTGTGAASTTPQYKEFKHGGDPFDNATALAMKDLPMVWNRVTGGGVPMEDATPQQVKQVQDVMARVRDEYLKITTKSREEMVKFVSAGYSPTDVQKAMESGDFSNLRKIHDPRQALSSDGIATMHQKNIERFTKENVDPLTQQLKPGVTQEMINAKAREETDNTLAYYNLGAQARGAQQGAIPGPKAGQAPQAGPTPKTGAAPQAVAEPPAAAAPKAAVSDPNKEKRDAFVQSLSESDQKSWTAAAANRDKYVKGGMTPQAAQERVVKEYPHLFKKWSTFSIKM